MKYRILSFGQRANCITQKVERSVDRLSNAIMINVQEQPNQFDCCTLTRKVGTNTQTVLLHATGLELTDQDFTNRYIGERCRT